MNVQKKQSNQKMLLEQILHILETNNDKRIIIVGTTCTGKSTLLSEVKKSVKGAADMDSILFPKLSKRESEYVCSTPWTEEIGKTMMRLAREKIKVENGKPIFGTVVLDCDIIIYIKIGDALLKERTALRKVSFDDAKRMQKQIEAEVKQSGIKAIELMI
jgi:pantothenate kinase